MKRRSKRIANVLKAFQMMLTIYSFLNHRNHKTSGRCDAPVLMTAAKPPPLVGGLVDDGRAHFLA